MPATKVTVKPVEEILAGIDSLNLDPIKVKLMDEEEGYGWSREHADLMVQEYRRFLHLNIKYPDRTVVCSTEVDKVWHTHILDTYKYAEDCEQVFGFFFHHFPYFGMRGEEDAANLLRCFEESIALYEEEFGEPRLELGASRCVPTEGGCAAPLPYCGKCESLTGSTASVMQHQVRPTLD